MEEYKSRPSKLYTLFEWIYRLLILNLLIIIISLPVITLLPTIVAAHATIKNNFDDTNIIKAFFKNFKSYFKKSFFCGLVLVLLAFIIIYSYAFYSYQATNSAYQEIMFKIGIPIMFLFGIIYILFCLNIPLLIITFTKLTMGEIFKTTFYISIRYLTTTLKLFSVFVVQIIGVALFPIWLICGISLPMLLGIKWTKKVYLEFEEIDLERIIHQVDEEEDL